MYENNFLVVILYFINVMFLIMWLFYYMMSFFLVMCLYCMLFYLFIVGFMYMGIIVSFIILFFWLIDYYVWYFLKYVICDWFKKVKYIFLNNVLFMLLEVWKKNCDLNSELYKRFFEYYNRNIFVWWLYKYVVF